MLQAYYENDIKEMSAGKSTLTATSTLTTTSVSQVIKAYANSLWIALTLLALAVCACAWVKSGFSGLPQVRPLAIKASNHFKLQADTRHAQLKSNLHLQLAESTLNITIVGQLQRSKGSYHQS